MSVFRSFVVLLIAMVSMTRAAGQPVSPDTSVLAVAGRDTITVGEFLQRSKSLSSQVIRYYLVNYKADIDTGFWNRDFEGFTPWERLKKSALDSLVKIKVQQRLATDEGLDVRISYNDFLKALTIENARRLEAKKANKVIYGPVQYSEEVYFSYTFSNMVNRLKEILAARQFNMEESQLMAEYEKDRDELYSKGFHTTLRVFSVENCEVQLKEKAWSDLENIRQLLLTREGKNFEEGLKIWVPGNSGLVKAEVISFNDTIYTPEEVSRKEDAIAEAMKTMKENTVSEVMERGGVMMLVFLENRKPLGYRSYDNCKHLVRSRHINRLYEEYVTKKVQDTPLYINRECFEHLRIH